MKSATLKYHIAAASLLLVSSCIIFLNGYNTGVNDTKKELQPIISKAEKESVDLTKHINSLAVYSELLEINIEDSNKKIASLNNKIKNLTKANGKYHIDTFKVTAYSPYENVSGIENNGEADATSTGATPRVGTIAVDPRVIPYGSKVVILYDDGTTYLGRAEDCGGAIKGNRLDVFKWSYKETEDHGIKNATVVWWK